MEAVINIEELKKHDSLYQAFQTNAEAIRQIDIDVHNLESAQTENKKKLEIATELGLPIKALKRDLKKNDKNIDTLLRMKQAYSNGYLEIPELTDWQSQEDVQEGESSSWWVFKPKADVPLRVFEALKKAKGMGIFDKLVIFKKIRKRDPILAGKIKDRYFYLASWR